MLIKLFLLILFTGCLGAFIFLKHLNFGEKLLLFIVMIALLLTFLIVCLFEW